MSTQKEDWTKIQGALQWLRDNYNTHPRALEALSRYEALGDAYYSKYQRHYYLDSFSDNTFNFQKAREQLSPKVPGLLFKHA